MPPASSNAAQPGWFARLTGRGARERDRMLPLYKAVVAAGRDPLWYRNGQVPDTVDGRFDMIAAVLALVLVRLEAEPGDDAKQASVMLTELFIDDMDESLREIGIGDYVVGKHVGRMVGALGGRLTAFRDAAAGGDYRPAVDRNIFHEKAVADDALDLVADRLRGFAAALERLPGAAVMAGRLPLP